MRSFITLCALLDVQQNEKQKAKHDGNFSARTQTPPRIRQGLNKSRIHCIEKRLKRLPSKAVTDNNMTKNQLDNVAVQFPFAMKFCVKATYALNNILISTGNNILEL